MLELCRPAVVPGGDGPTVGQHLDVGRPFADARLDREHHTYADKKWLNNSLVNEIKAKQINFIPCSGKFSNKLFF